MKKFVLFISLLIIGSRAWGSEQKADHEKAHLSFLTSLKNFIKHGSPNNYGQLMNGNQRTEKEDLFLWQLSKYLYLESEHNEIQNGAKLRALQESARKYRNELAFGKFDAKMQKIKLKLNQPATILTAELTEFGIKKRWQSHGKPLMELYKKLYSPNFNDLKSPKELEKEMGWNKNLCQILSLWTRSSIIYAISSIKSKM